MTPVAGDEARDPGLQPERTRLAWRRTTLACTVAAVLAARQGLHEGLSGAGLPAAGLSLLVWLAFLGVAHRRIRELGPARPRPLGLGAAAAAAACTVALAAFGVGVVL